MKRSCLLFSASLLPSIISRPLRLVRHVGNNRPKQRTKSPLGVQGIIQVIVHLLLCFPIKLFICIFVPKWGFHHCASETSMRRRNRISHHIWILKWTEFKVLWTLTMCINPKWLTAKTMLALIVVFCFLSFIMFFLYTVECVNLWLHMFNV